MSQTATLKTLIIALLILIGTQVAPAQDMPPTLVETATIQTMSFHEQITLVGRTEAQIDSRIVAEVSGQVDRIVAGEGNWVAAGDVLLSLDSEPHRLTLEAKDAELEEARTQTALAESNMKRVDDLFAKKLVSETKRDSALAWLVIAKARERKTRADRDQLARDFGNCKIKAPFSGYTGRHLIDVGEWVAPGTPVYEMVDLSHLTVVVDLPERHFGRLDMESPVEITASVGSGHTLSGKITGFAPRATSETHTYPIIVTVENSDGVIGSGALVRATVSLDKEFESLAVDKDAIVRQGPQTMIYTIHDGQAAPIPVVVVANQGTMSAIQGEGLSAGMPVVVRGNERIFPGSPVRTAGGAPPDAGAPEPGSSEEQPAESGT